MKRHFEFVDGSSSKFWTIIIAGCNVTVCFGRIGTQGQSQSKTLISPTAAQRHADKLIAEKIKKGYAETVAA
jgi:predicted DNA-binding WGR domain protein